MKHIKNFEDIKYKVGDYVKLVDDYIYQGYVYAKILHIGTDSINTKLDYDYYIKSFKLDVNDYNNFEMWIKDNKIIRKLNDDEIEIFKLKENAEKYKL